MTERDLFPVENTIATPPPTTASSRAMSKYVVAFASLFLITIIPFALCSPLPLSDYPNHLARMYIIANVDHIPALARYYSIKWSFIPNLAMDLIVPLAIPPLSAEVASAAFVAVTLALLATGAIALNWELFRRRSFAPFLVFGLLYSRSFLWGFINYLFAVGISLWMLVAYLRLRDRNPVFRTCVFTVLSMGLLIGHLHAFASYAVAVAAIECSIAWRTRRTTGRLEWMPVLVGLSQFVIPAIVDLAFSRPTRASQVKFGTPFDKAAGLFDLVNNYSIPFDALTLVVFAALFAVGVWRKWIGIHRDMRLALFGLFALYLALPTLLLGSMGADRRILVAFSMLLVASIDLQGLSLRVQQGFAIACVALFLARMSIIGVNWIEAQRVYDPVLRAIDRVETGTRLAVIAGSRTFPFLRNPPLEHLPNMAVVRKDVFVNSLFAEAGKQILQVYTGEHVPFSIDQSQNYRLSDAEYGSADPLPSVPIERFDYVLLVNREAFVKAYPDSLEPVYDEGLVRLFRVRRGRRPPSP
jgi:hypothetical protein